MLSHKGRVAFSELMTPVCATALHYRGVTSPQVSVLRELSACEIAVVKCSTSLSALLGAGDSCSCGEVDYACTSMCTHRCLSDVEAQVRMMKYLPATSAPPP